LSTIAEVFLRQQLKARTRRIRESTKGFSFLREAFRKLRIPSRLVEVGQVCLPIPPLFRSKPSTPCVASKSFQAPGGGHPCPTSTPALAVILQKSPKIMLGARVRRLFKS